MNHLQKYFEEFHESIKLDSENKDLRSSRDAIKDKLTSSFRDYFKNTTISVPDFFDQGSYTMGTGVKPLEEGSFDIDEGVKFNITTRENSDPVEIKKLIKNALAGHTELGVEIKEPCVRVIYSENGEERYHVDLAIYATNGQNTRGAILQLGRGKEFSLDENRYWEDSQPEKLIDLVNNKYVKEEERAQFRRVIRYLKRWKDLHFSSLGNEAPRGIALTIAAYNLFIPVFSTDGSPNDSLALILFVKELIKNIQRVFTDGEYVNRLICMLPVPPYNDLFSKMTNKQMEKFIKKLNELNQLLDVANNQSLEDEACLTLAEVFGEDFPAPDVSKAFQIVKKPSLGYFPKLENIANFDKAPYLISIKGFVFVKGKWVPFNSNRKVLGSKRLLEFRAHGDHIDNADIFWRVVNTGTHVITASIGLGEKDTFRGDLFKARVVNSVNNQIAIIPSDDEFINQEVTAYTGKHWIECIAVVNNTCIARSKPFYVHIFNPEFQHYD